MTAAFRDADYRLLPVMMSLLIVFFALKAYRWKLLLTPIERLTTWQVTPAMMIGFAFNNLLPAHLGEFVRVFVLGKQFGLPKTPVLSTVVLERILDIIAILSLLGFSLLFIDNMPPEAKQGSLIFAAISICGVIMLGIYMAFTTQFVAFADAILSRLKFVPEKIRTGVLEMLSTGAVGLEAVKDPKLLIPIILTSFGQWIANGLMIYFALRSFGVYVAVPHGFLVMGITAIGVTIPGPPGYFGIIQGCFKISLGPLGYDQAKTFAGSIYYHMCQYIPVTLTGLAFLSKVGLSFGDVRREAQQKKDE